MSIHSIGTSDMGDRKKGKECEKRPTTSSILDQDSGEIVASSGRVIKRPRRDFGDIWESDIISPRRTGGRKTATKAAAASQANAAQKEPPPKTFERTTRSKTGSSKSKTCDAAAAGGTDQGARTVGPDDAKPPEKPRRKKPIDRPKWTNHDIAMFYNGIKEHGRDWKRLHTYIKRHRTFTSASFDRNQEDVRQFYYRSWHKIAKFIQAPEGLDKQVLELFSLICYGCIRKKVGNGLTAKIGNNLNQLVMKGSTQIRYKMGKKTYGATVAVPSCPTVKSIFNLEGLRFEKVDNAVRLPEFIKLELRPRTNAAWWNVQNMAQNPRLRTSLTPLQHLGLVIKHLNKKWKPNRLRAKEQLNEVGERQWRELRLTPPSGATPQCWDFSKVYPSKLPQGTPRYLGIEEFLQNVRNLNLGSKQLVARISKFTRPVIIKMPAVSTEAPPPTLTSNVPDASSANASSNKNSTVTSPTYSKPPDGDPLFNFKMAASILMDSANNPAASCENNNREMPRLESQIREPTEDIALETACDLPVLDIAVKHPHGSGARRSSVDSSNASRSTQKSVNLTSPSRDNAILSPRSEETKQDVSPPTKTTTNSPYNKQGSTEGDMSGLPVAQGVTMSEKVEAVKSGLTIANAKNVTAAELFLMMGSPQDGKITLEYDWIDTVPDTMPDVLDMASVANAMRRLVHLGSTELATEVQVRQPPPPPPPKPSAPPCCQCGLPSSSEGSSRPPGRPKKKALKANHCYRNDLGIDRYNNRSYQPFSISPDVTEGGQLLVPSSKLTVCATTTSALSGAILSITDASSSSSSSSAASGPPQPPVFKVPSTPQTRPIRMPFILPKPIVTAENGVSRVIMMSKRPRLRRKSMLIQRPLLPKTSDSGPQTYIINNKGIVVSQTPSNVKQVDPMDAFKGVQFRNFRQQDFMPASSRMASISRTNSAYVTAAESKAQPGTSHTQATVQRVGLEAKTMQQSSGTATSAISHSTVLSTSSGSNTSFMSSLLDDQSSLSAMDDALQNLLCESTPISSPEPSTSRVTAAASMSPPLMGLSSSSLVNEACLEAPSLLDLSLPSLPAEDGGDSDKFLDMPLITNGGTSFNVSALLQSCCNNEALSSVHVDTSAAISSAGALSPSKLLRLPSGLGDDSNMSWLNSGEEFHLSNLLDNSQMKTPTAGSSSDIHPLPSLSNLGPSLGNMGPSLSNMPSSLSNLPLDALGGNTQSLFNIGESSRDSMKHFDVAAALNTVLAENSLDCFNKFESANLEINPSDIPSTSSQ